MRDPKKDPCHKCPFPVSGCQKFCDDYKKWKTLKEKEVSKDV
jgi:hypothetical protein